LVRAIRWVAIGALFVGAALAHGDQLEPASRPALEALFLCQAADKLPVSERAAALANGLDCAERAVKADPQDAAAHFAIFCNLGKQIQFEQHKLWVLARLGDLDRARRELDIALELAPDYVGAVAAKGEMLIELPAFLGGDAQEGERLLRHAVVLDPDDPHIRIMLANLLQATGRHEEARTHAEVALAILERTGPSPDMDGARTLIAGSK